MFMQKFTRSNLFRGSYFHILIVGHKNCENLDLAKISRYTVWENHVTYFKQRTYILVLWCHCENHSPNVHSLPSCLISDCIVTHFGHWIVFGCVLQRSWLISLTPSGLKTATQGLQAEKEVHTSDTCYQVRNLSVWWFSYFFFFTFLQTAAYVFFPSLYLELSLIFVQRR